MNVILAVLLGIVVLVILVKLALGLIGIVIGLAFAVGVYLILERPIGRR